MCPEAGTAEETSVKTPRRDGQEASMHYRKIIMNLFDGDGGAAAGGGEGSGGEGTKSAIDSKVAARGKSLGLSDDMLQVYNDAFGEKSSGNEEETETEIQEGNTEEELDSEFQKLIEGKYKNAYKKTMSAAVKDRLTNANREKSDLQKQLDSGNRILKMLEGKYELDPNDPDALYKAVRDDGDIWRDRAIQTGGSIEEAVNAFDDAQKQESERLELENYRRQDRARQLDMRLQEIAKDVQKEYPSFDLKQEFENARFRQALDFIAQVNSDENKRTGKNDEIYDLKYAYEMAHADEIRQNLIERTSKATASAYAQTIAANRGRVKENAAQSRGQNAVDHVDLLSMSDDDLEALKRDILSGKQSIPG